MRPAPRQLTGVAAVSIVLASGLACEKAIGLLKSIDAWPRHTIDDSFSGADGVKLGDVNQDGRLDLVVPWEESGRVRVYLNPSPHSTASNWPAVTVGEVASVEDAVFVDLDDDDNLDVVSCAQGDVRSLFIHWAPSDTTQLLVSSSWTTEVIPASQNARQWLFCTPAQIDGQHGWDLVAGAKEDQAQIGWFESPPQARDLDAWQWHAIADGGWFMSIEAFDMDDDGDPDVVASDRKGPDRGVYWFENPGSGTAQRRPWVRREISAAIKDEPMFMDLDDIDGDGLVDVVLATNQHYLMLYRQSSPGGLSWEGSVITLSQALGTGKGVGIADIDMDGRMDIAVSSESADGKIGVAWMSYLNEPRDAVWQTHAISGQVGSKFDLIQIIDLDEDGDPDLLTTEENAGLGVAWYQNPLN